MSENSSTAEQESLRQQISESRGALAEKLEMLEEKVAESVHSATSSMAEATASVVETVQNATASVSETVGQVNSAVQGTMESVRSKVEDTVHALKDSLDLSEHVRQHPWPTLAGAVAIGFVAGRLLNGSDERQNGYDYDDDRYQEPWAEYNPAAAYEPASWAAQRESQVASYGQNGGRGPDFQRRSSTVGARPSTAAPASKLASASDSWMSQLKNMFQGEIEKIQGLAIGTSLGLLRDVVSQSAPPTLRTHITEIIDDMTEKLGGQKISEPILSQNQSADGARSQL